MKNLYLLNDISWEDREMVSRIYKDRESAKKELDLRIAQHMDDFWLEKEDFNRDNNAWAVMELRDDSMYDWEHWIEIYFIPLPIENE